MQYSLLHMEMVNPYMYNHISILCFRQREEEARRRLLENPIKMKMLQKEVNITWIALSP